MCGDICLICSGNILINWNIFLQNAKLTLLFLFKVLSDQSKFEQADELYQEALQVDPNNANLFVHRGLIHLQWKGDIEKAVELITK